MEIRKNSLLIKKSGCLRWGSIPAPIVRTAIQDSRFLIRHKSLGIIRSIQINGIKFIKG